MLSFTWKKHVHELAIGGTGAHVLDLCVGQAEAMVDPGEHVVAGQVVGRDGRVVHVHCHLEQKI